MSNFHDNRASELEAEVHQSKLCDLHTEHGMKGSRNRWCTWVLLGSCTPLLSPDENKLGLIWRSGNPYMNVQLSFPTQLACQHVERSSEASAELNLTL